MELKRKFTFSITEALNSFNRTFMELKQRRPERRARPRARFNRTFMELKRDNLYFSTVIFSRF